MAMAAWSIGQTLILPSPPQHAVGKGVCEGVEIAIASENWRVRKGDVFEVRAVQIFSDNPELKFHWIVENGKIVSGQGTEWISVKAGGAKTNGYLNASGFVVIRLSVLGAGRLAECKFEFSERVMVGKHRERNLYANVTGLKLDETTVSHPCPPGRMPFEDAVVSEDMIIDVGVTASDPENDVLYYAYRATGGKVTGNGANVRWDLTNVPPGTYTIFSGVDDGRGMFGKTQKAVVTVVDCNACGLCECPTVEISGPIDEILSTGENTFTANVSGGTQPEVTYQWSVTNGVIVSGLASPSIRVTFLDSALESTATVSLKIGGIDPTCACLTEHVVEYVNGRRLP